jgi:hypothetical protein
MTSPLLLLPLEDFLLAPHIHPEGGDYPVGWGPVLKKKVWRKTCETDFNQIVSFLTAEVVRMFDYFSGCLFSPILSA